MVGDLEGGAGVLLDQHHRHPHLLVQPGDDGEDFTDQDGRQAEAGLVEEHDPGPSHQTPADRQHLLLPAGQGAGGLVPALAEIREIVVHRLDIATRRPGIAPREGAHHQVLGHGQEREHLTPLGHMGDALAHDGVGLAAMDRLASQEYLALARLHHTRDCLQEGRLAGPVRPEDRDDPPAVNSEADPAQGHDRPVERLEVADLENRPGHAAASAPR